jgi:predicted esterase
MPGTAARDHHLVSHRSSPGDRVIRRRTKLTQDISSPHTDGIVTQRVQPPTKKVSPGQHRLALDQPRDGLLLVPEQPHAIPHPLIVLLHGAGADAENIIGILDRFSAQHSAALLVPESRLHTWDIILGGFGPDVAFLDRALAAAFRRCLIDASRIAIAGFSDGASYALTVGLANGGLFTHIMAFSPGFMVPHRYQGKPKVYISHGTDDQVLPIARCSRRIVPQLQQLEYEVTYHEFADGHTVPIHIASEGMEWFTACHSKT